MPFRLLSAIHLNVLQTLLVSSALPDGLLRAVGAHVAGLLVPSAGLEPVFRSASIDVDTIKSKLDAVGIYDLPGASFEWYQYVLSYAES